jgi:hypothetical protein
MTTRLQGHNWSINSSTVYPGTFQSWEPSYEGVPLRFNCENLDESIGCLIQHCERNFGTSSKKEVKEHISRLFDKVEDAFEELDEEYDEKFMRRLEKIETELQGLSDLIS